MNSDIRSNDPCPCGSQVRYVDCHKEIVEALPHEVLAVARRQYARRWAGNASSYEAQGIYRRLADHLTQHVKPSCLMDIGCGRGEGLVALRGILTQPDSCLVGVDENPDCLIAAAARLDLPPPPERLSRVSAEGRNYDLIVRSGLLPTKQPIALIQSDVRRPDPELDTFLREVGPFDAVTLWFNGIHPARQFDVFIQADGLNDDRAVRMAVELDAAEIACHFVRPGGVLQVASRGASRSEATCRAEVEPEMEELARASGLTLINLALYGYDEPTMGERIIVGQPDRYSSSMNSFVTSAIFYIGS